RAALAHLDVEAGLGEDRRHGPGLVLGHRLRDGAGSAPQELDGAVLGDEEALRDERRGPAQVLGQGDEHDDYVVHHCLPAGTGWRAKSSLSSAARRATSARAGESPKAASIACTSSSTRPTGTASGLRPSS